MKNYVGHKKASRFLSWLTLLVTSCLSGPALSWQFIQTEMPDVYSLSLDEGDILNGNISEASPSTNPKDRPGNFRVFILYSTMTDDQECGYNLPAMSVEQWQERWRTNASDIVNSIRNNCTVRFEYDEEKLKDYRLMIYITTTTKWYDGVSYYQFFIDMSGAGAPSGPPASCDAQVPDSMRFGIISGPGPYKSETNMYVKCSQKTAFDVKVNNSREFIDPESGTRITFEDFSTGSLALDCKDGCTVPIPGEMTAAPTKPGKYQWAVPVIVEYK
ncbi:hypothetical protein [Vibrio sp. 11986-1-5]|uniref:hypothetical protein n=1 Tax=Vibrio sp. 11986-1-5 TaxID=2211215 RepID=UPI000D73CF80|nr:hypothetical protein [Vibrio sp. 11986-1-5]PXA74570.1 hypothetical protein DMC15_00810 [Vibrio sp. 11986-1-5]